MRLKRLLTSARDKSPQNPKNVQRTTELERMILKRARESKREQILMNRRRVMSAESLTEDGGCKRMNELRRSKVPVPEDKRDGLQKLLLIVCAILFMTTGVKGSRTFPGVR